MRLSPPIFAFAIILFATAIIFVKAKRLRLGLLCALIVFTVVGVAGLVG